MKTKRQKKFVQYKEHRYTVIFEPDENGYHAFCPTLQGCHTCGNTLKEAIRNIQEAVEVYCESLEKHEETLPVC